MCDVGVCYLLLLALKPWCFFFVLFRLRRTFHIRNGFTTQFPELSVHVTFSVFNSLGLRAMGQLFLQCSLVRRDCE